MTGKCEIHENNENVSNRRQFMKTAVLAAVATTFAPARKALAVLDENPADRKALSLYNVHTDEQAYAIYWQNGQYNPKGLYHVDYILRDFRENKIIEIDPRLVNLIHDITATADTTGPVHIISGYHSPQTNEFLRNSRGGIAKSSLHVVGQAVDMRIPGVPTKYLRQVAVELKAGGVGYYPDSDFIHIDIGRVRYW